ncbi:hypothetical protein [Nakamurella leprariae]|uniref:Uncharacterized protein n=1 Tax=Nakamurella leprariae TaxID=2803911 RepID=A0A939BXN1_9ACTN|nr:hypothetical protein [Nakamurella leprariae]MBM9468728.1 hypothetical protein [Nakamurella leprariae]
MTFSLAGLLVSLAVLTPNLLLAVAPPRDRPTVLPTLPGPIVVLERVGQAGCLVAPALTGQPARADARLVLVVLLVAGHLPTARRIARITNR